MTLIEMAKEARLSIYKGREYCVAHYKDGALEAFAELIRADERAKLELQGYWKQGDNLDESDYFPIADFPHVDPTGCTPLYAVKEIV